MKDHKICVSIVTKYLSVNWYGQGQSRPSWMCCNNLFLQNMTLKSYSETSTCAQCKAGEAYSLREVQKWENDLKVILQSSNTKYNNELKQMHTLLMARNQRMARTKDIIAFTFSLLKKKKNRTFEWGN